MALVQSQFNGFDFVCEIWVLFAERCTIEFFVVECRWSKSG
jgi:hypothetical protein